MNKDRRAAIAKLADELEGIRSQIEDLQNEEQEYYDNMPESFQSGDKGQAAEAAAEALSSAVDSVQDAISSLESAQE